MTIAGSDISGSVHLETEDGKRGYQAQFRGVVESSDGRVSRFDMVSLGKFWGEGRYTKRAPKGKFPFAVSMTLADGTDVADKIPPQGSRGWIRGYMQP